MKFLVIIYNDPALLAKLPEGELDATLRGCFHHTAKLEGKGTLLESQMLAPASTARSIRVRDGVREIFDGPFAETKELLGGFNLIEAADMDEAVRIASQFPWAETGAIEVRAVEDLDAVKRRVGV